MVAKTDLDKLTFEEALKQLEEIVGRLESGRVELEESIAIYERGDALRIARAAAVEFAGGDDVVFHLKFD